MLTGFADMHDHNDVAAYFGMSYAKLAGLIYQLDPEFKYTRFEVRKKTGGVRTIKAPCKRLKKLQVQLKDELYGMYSPRKSTHGFAKKRSIVTNASAHLDKRLLLNLDLEDFFGTIHFGRVRNLFKAHPFDFTHEVATILAQTCCFENSLPQGAPTSPVIANMICWRLDSELQALAYRHNSTYTRYADDITFSFTCRRNRLPATIASEDGGRVHIGKHLTGIIHRHGFRINQAKVRLASRSQRMEVTGLTVNEAPNVPRTYIRQVRSMLHAWRAYGYEAAEQVFNEQFDSRYRASDVPKSLTHVIRGKLAFLSSVKTKRDPVYVRLARWYNSLEPEESLHVPFHDLTGPEEAARKSLWVIEGCFDEPAGSDGPTVIAGTGFSLHGVGMVTCAHVVCDKGGKAFDDLAVYKPDAPDARYSIGAIRADTHRDIAVCQLVGAPPAKLGVDALKLSAHAIAQRMPVTLMGFPNFSVGATASITDATVAATLTRHGVKQFEIGTQIRMGNSGGPLIDADGAVLGMAVSGATIDEGHNAAICWSEIDAFISEI